MAKEFAKDFYASAAWEQARTLALIRDHYLCAKCGQLAEEVHHIIPLTPLNIHDPSVSLCQDNLICLCHDCHTRTHKYGSECIFDDNGQLVQII